TLAVRRVVDDGPLHNLRGLRRRVLGPGGLVERDREAPQCSVAPDNLALGVRRVSLPRREVDIPLPWLELRTSLVPDENHLVLPHVVGRRALPDRVLLVPHDGRSRTDTRLLHVVVPNAHDV